MTATRKECRKALADFLRADLSTLVDSNWVLDHQLTDFDGATPIVQVTSAGVDWDNATMRGGKNIYFLSVESFVLHKHTESGWTEAMAEDLIDDIGEAVLDCLVRNKSKGLWMKIRLHERTLVTRTAVSGLTYLYEVFPIILEVM